MVVLDGDNEVDPGVGKGLEDIWVGVVDLDLVDESGLEELSYFLGRWKVVAEGAIVYANAINIWQWLEQKE